MPTSILILAALAIVGLIAARRRWRIVAALAAGLAIGSLGYFAVGILVARQRGVGHFYSVPFGGERVGDAEVLGSLSVWTLASAAILLGAFALLRKPAREPGQSQ